MQNRLITWVFGASLALSGCSWLNNIPFVYKPDIQQGNVVEQGMIDQLRPGMTKTQVVYVLGTPMLADVFHQDRWDYVYRLKEGRADTISHRVALLFDGNELIQIEGDFYPQPKDETAPRQEEMVVDIPDHKRGRHGLLGKAVDVLTFGMSGEDR